MASYLDKRYPKAEMSTPDDAKPRGRTPTFRALLTILFSLVAAFYYVYPSLVATFYYLYPEPQTISYPYPYGNDDSPSENVDWEWPLIKIPGSDYPAVGEAYAIYDESELFEGIEPFDPVKRYSLDYGRVACWQNNGVWIKKLTPVEMSSLGVNRFQDTDRAPEQADEDAFCSRLRIYGASFWNLPPEWPENVYQCGAIDNCVEPIKKVSLEVGFPTSGGVWVLNTSQGGETLFPKSVGLRNALTMDERCEVIKDLGGVFCEDAQVCAEMDRLLGP